MHQLFPAGELQPARKSDNKSFGGLDCTLSLLVAMVSTPLYFPVSNVQLVIEERVDEPWTPALQCSYPELFLILSVQNQLHALSISYI